jgi:hypothetical protein
MAQNEDSFELDESGRSEYVPAVFARSMEEAEKYRELLDDHDIPAIIGADEPEEESRKRRQRGISRGLPVLVPEALLDEASEVIAERAEQADEFEADTDDDLEDDDDEEEEEEDEELELEEGLELDEEEELEEEADEFEETSEEDQEEEGQEGKGPGAEGG